MALLSLKEYLKEDVSAKFEKKSEKSGVSVGTLRKVYNRGVAAWKTGHSLELLHNSGDWQGSTHL